LPRAWRNYELVSCPPDVNCAGFGCLSGFDASPPNGNPLYWPRVGSCPTPFAATYDATLDDGHDISPKFRYIFSCGGASAASDGIPFANP